MKNTRVLVFAGLLLAMQLVLTRYIVIQTDILRISFGFLPQSISSMMFGPFIGATIGAVEDLLGMAIAAKGAYFPGFTFSAMLTGAIYGFFLYKKPKSIFRIILAVLTVTLVVDLGLNTLWLTMITGKAAAVLLPSRLLKSAIMFPVQVSMIFVLWQSAGNFLEKKYLVKNS